MNLHARIAARRAMLERQGAAPEPPRVHYGDLFQAGQPRGAEWPWRIMAVDLVVAMGVCMAAVWGLAHPIVSQVLAIVLKGG